MIRFDLPKDYPEVSVPMYRVKNLCKEYLDSNDLYRYEELIRDRAKESIGAPMIFDLCDMIREEIADLNEAVLNKFDIIEEKEKKKAAADALPQSFASNVTTFTQVTKESFDAFVIRYKKRIGKERETLKTPHDDRPTGKAIFLDKANSYDDLTLEDETAESEAHHFETKEEA
jgi:hypothetical protein